MMLHVSVNINCWKANDSANWLCKWIIWNIEAVILRRGPGVALRPSQAVRSKSLRTRANTREIADTRVRFAFVVFHATHGCPCQIISAGTDIHFSLSVPLRISVRYRAVTVEEAWIFGYPCKNSISDSPIRARTVVFCPTLHDSTQAEFQELTW